MPTIPSILPRGSPLDKRITCKNLFHRQISEQVLGLKLSLQALSLQGATKSVLQPVEVTIFLISSHTCTEISTPSQTPPSTRHVFALRHPENNSATTSGIHGPAEMAETLCKRKVLLVQQGSTAAVAIASQQVRAESGKQHSILTHPCLEG